jgi:MYXO-CTERM domain-containing protein
MKRLRLGLLFASLALGLGASGSPAGAVTITCCTTSSDQTPASSIAVVLDFAVAGSTLTLTATNLSASTYRVNQIYFNATDDVTSLTLTSATHSAAGVVTSRWSVLADEDAGPFKGFDFELAGGTGARPWVLDPSESVVFVLSIGGTGPFTADDFGVVNTEGYQAAAKFQGGPDDPETPGSEDSAFGAVPEVSLLGLLAVGALLAVARRGS